MSRAGPELQLWQLPRFSLILVCLFFVLSFQTRHFLVSRVSRCCNLCPAPKVDLLSVFVLQLVSLLDLFACSD